MRWRLALHGASGEDQVVAAGDSELEEAQPVDEPESEPESEAREGDDGDGEERVEGDEEEEDRRREQPNALVVALLSSPLLAQTEEGFVDDNKQCTLQACPLPASLASSPYYPFPLTDSPSRPHLSLFSPAVRAQYASSSSLQAGQKRR